MTAPLMVDPYSLGAIADVQARKLVVNTDRRGSLVELFREDELSGSDIALPRMGYLSLTLPGIARGPHEHAAQADFFVFLGTAPFDVFLWERRPHYRLIKQHLRFAAGEIWALSIPPGVVHAYRNASADAIGQVANFPDALFAGWNKKLPVDEIRYEGTSDSPFELWDPAHDNRDP